MKTSFRNSLTLANTRQIESIGMLESGRNQDRKEPYQAKVQCDLLSTPHAIHTGTSDASFMILLPVVADWKDAHRSVNMGHL